MDIYRPKGLPVFFLRRQEGRTHLMIPFNVPPYVGAEDPYLADVIKRRKLCGDGRYTALCSDWLTKNIGSAKSLLTTSCTHALEMAALLCDLKDGDEVIMPSYTFVSTANAFVLRGARVVFVDIRPDTMNLDEKLIEDAVTDRTRVIVPVDYAGVSCDMDAITDIARRRNLFVVEDAAQAVGSFWRGQPCGSLADFGCFSFHETKNVSCGEGGALVIRNHTHAERAEIIREKGTDRSKFHRGEVDKYSWIDVGSSYLPSEFNAAYLYAQLENIETIQNDRMRSWERYREGLQDLADAGAIELPVIPSGCRHNAHMFYIKTRGLEERTALIAHLKENGVQSVFHYLPLHSSKAGRKYSRFHGHDRYTTAESERLLRLPLYYGLTEQDNETAVRAVRSFYESGRNRCGA